MKICDNENMAAKLTDLFSGHLSEGEQAPLKVHLQQCEACQKTYGAMKLLAGQPTGLEHPQSELLVKYYENKDSLTEAQCQEMKEHLSTCEACAYDYDFLRSMETELEQSVAMELNQPSLMENILSTLTMPLKQPAVAYFLLALTLYPASQWLLQSTDTTDTASATISQPFELRLTTRAGGELPEVLRSAETGLELLELPYYHLQSDYYYEFYLKETESGRDLPLERIADFETAGRIRLLTRLIDLPDGIYTLTLLEIDRATNADTTRSSFTFKLVAGK